MKFYKLFYIFCPSGSGSGSREPIESGSNLDPDTDPDPQHCIARTVRRIWQTFQIRILTRTGPKSSRARVLPYPDPQHCPWKPLQSASWRPTNQSVWPSSQLLSSVFRTPVLRAHCLSVVFNWTSINPELLTQTKRNRIPLSLRLSGIQFCLVWD